MSSITTQTLLVVALFVVLLALLPWGVRWLQRRAQGGMLAAGPGSRLVGALAVGPQQRVVTIEVGPPQARVWLVLGVTAQNVTLLHSMPANTANAAATTDFATQLARAEGAPPARQEPAL